MGENKVRHLGVIMDGNRRWARQHQLQTVLKGHEAGAKTLFDMAEWCVRADIRYLTVYAFSTENWRRSQEEVAGLFSLMESAFFNEIERCVENGIRMCIIGNHALLDERARKIIRETEERTAHCDRLTILVALSYGGRDEITRAVQALAAEVAAGRLAPDAIAEESIEHHLDTAGVPDIDLVIRTGGQQRLSNFFPWQTVYADLYFLDTLWPDFTQQDLQDALDYYQRVQVNKGK